MIFCRTCETMCGRLWVTLSTGLVYVRPSINACQRESPAVTACIFGASVTHLHNKEHIDKVPLTQEYVQSKCKASLYMHL